MKENIVIYVSKDEKIKVNTNIEKENIWMTQQQIVDLFQVQRPAITKHLKNIFEDGELEENSVVKKILTTVSDRKKYKTDFYNLDATIAVGFKKSNRI